MFHPFSRLGTTLFGIVLLGAAGAWFAAGSRTKAQDVPADPQPVDAPGQEVLTQGPVHEAFAEPTTQNAAAPLVVPKQPPAPVEEMPPDVKPDGTNVEWISGYWAWDDGKKDFVWVSGIWRDAPPGHVWLAGYWNNTQDGAQWTPGFWTTAAQKEVNYLPEPPNSLETASPSTPAPSPSDFYVPGYWNYVGARYVWRPGYWTAAQPDWIWIPTHYVWTPSGYVFIPGHWDYALERRGVLFAPVYFAPGVYLRPRFVWGPSVVIDPGVLTVNFFVRPGYGHYYFGDCYGPAYVSLGYRPWFSAGVTVGYDPLFTYYRWSHRADPGWAIGVRDRYVFMEAHPEARPPRTYAASLAVGVNVGGVRVALTLNDYARRPAMGPGHGAPMHFSTVSMAQRQALAHEAIRSNAIVQERARMETSGGGPGEHRAMNLDTLGRAGGGHLPGASAAVASNHGQEALRGIGSAHPSTVGPNAAHGGQPMPNSRLPANGKPPVNGQPKQPQRDPREAKGNEGPHF